MSPTRVIKAALVSPETTMQDLMARFMKRDDDHKEAWQAVTNQYRDLGRQVEAMQVDLQRVGRLLEKQDGINERQIRLAETTQTHGETFQRAFGEIEKLQASFPLALERVVRGFEDRMDRSEKECAAVSKSVTAYGGGLKVGAAVTGLVILLLSTIATLWGGYMERTTTKLETKVDANKIATDIRVEALSNQVQEVRIARQRDREKQEDVQ